MDIRSGSAYEVVSKIIDRYESPSDRNFEGGGRLVCNLTWVHENRWLHRVMPPCPYDEIAGLAVSTGRQPPRCLAEFLLDANGLSIFNSSLNIFGVRRDFTRSPETANLLPFDLASHSLSWNALLGPHDFLVGSCGPDVDVCIWRSTSGQIHRVDQKSSVVLEAWPSFHDWLVVEAERFAAMHSSDGRLIDGVISQAGKAAPWPQESILQGSLERWSPAWWQALERRLHVPFDTLPFGWLDKLTLAVLQTINKWLKNK